MNIVLIAWCSTSAYLATLAKAGEAPKLVVTGATTSAAPGIEAACARLDVPVLRVDDMNADHVVERVASVDPDLLLVTGCSQRLRSALLDTAKVARLNFHPSLLPHYRAKEPLFWAILRGEAKIGVTVHHLTHEMDSGPVIWSTLIPVPDDATSASLAASADEVGCSFLPDLLAMVHEGGVPHGISSTEPGSHFPPLRPEHGLIDFTQDAVTIERLVRASTGEILAYTFYRGMKIGVLSAAADPNARTSRRPGRIEKMENGSMTVGAAVGAVELRRLLFMDRGYDAGALAKELGMGVGDMLSANPAFF